MSTPRHSTTHTIGSLNSGGSLASFNTDEDGSEMGHLSVSVSELNQLRQHVRNMRENMTSSNKNLRTQSTSPTRHLEEVEIGRNASSAAGDGLVVSESALSPQEKRRRFRLAIIGNFMFALGSLLYICVAHGDLEWAKDIQGIPTKVLNADDDATWRTWQKHQSAQSQGKEPKERGRTRRLAMQQDQDMDYNDMLWQDLPMDIQLALEVLGHNRHTWNNQETSSIEVQPWSNLTQEQKQAAKVIGYTKQEWDDEEERQEEAWEKTKEAYFSNDDAQMATDGGDDRYEDDDEGDDRAVDDDRRNDDRRNDDRYEDDRYEDDDEDDRVADDDRRRGDDRYEDDEEEDDRYEDDDEEEDDRYADDDLPDDDKTATAGEVFDWYKESNKDPNYPQEVSTGAVTPRPTPQAAKATNPPTTAPPKPAAEQEKYTAGATAPEKPPEGYTIDGTPITNAPIPKEELTVAPQIAELDINSPDDLMIWGDYDWEDLPDGVKKAFEILGYDEELWNTGGTAFTEDLYWEDLTPDQQAQAGVLGYTQKLWDQAEDENWDIVTGEQGDDDEEGDDAEYDDDEEDDDEYSVDAPADDDEDPLVRLGYVEDDAESEAITLFFASFCFMVAGVMNWIREKQVFHMWMVQGGVFGVLAALTMGFSDFASLLLQTVSVHCFLLQSVFMLRLRKTIRPVEGLENISKALWCADILFCAGAFLQVVMVYWLHGDSNAYYDLGLGYIEVMAAWFWFFTAAIYTMNTLALVNKSIHEEDNTDNQSQVSRTLTITRQHPNGESYTIRPAAIQLRNKPCHDVVLT